MISCRGAVGQRGGNEPGSTGGDVSPLDLQTFCGSRTGFPKGSTKEIEGVGNGITVVKNLELPRGGAEKKMEGPWYRERGGAAALNLSAKQGPMRKHMTWRHVE